MAHTAEVLAAFQDGEVRLVFGRDKGTDELVLLEDGTAKAKRAYTKASLQCPIRDCPTPHMTTVARKKKRDGYMHLSGGGHAPEGIFHIQGYEMIARWLREKYPAPWFRVQKEERSNAAGERRADVMVTRAETGTRIAFEIQYASLSPDKWQERHDSYARQGIQDVWLFGHAGAQFYVDRHRAGEVHLNPTHEAVVASGLPLLWINPFTEQLGTAVSNGYGESDAPVDIPTLGGSGRLALSPLADFSVSDVGLTSALLNQLAANRRADGERGAELARSEAARQERILRDRSMAAERAETLKRELAQKRIWAASTAKSLEPAWQATETYKAFLDKFGGEWPAFLNVEITSGPGMPLPASMWQSALFTEFWENRRSGYHILEAKCAVFLAVPGLMKSEVAPMVREWLKALTAAGYAKEKRQRSTGFAIQMPGRQTIGEKALWAAAVAKAEARLGQGTAVTPNAIEADPNRPLEVPTPGGAASPDEPRATRQTTNPLCPVCNLPLFDGFLERGMHAICARGWRA